MSVAVNVLVEVDDREQVVRAAEDAVRAVLRFERRSDGVEVSVALVDDARIRQLNRDYRGRDRPTDVLSFPMSETVETEDGGTLFLLGDVVVSLPAAIRQAGEYGWTPAEEIARLVVHGTLHLLGYDHEEDAAEAEIMRRREEKILRRMGLDIIEE